jgi:hypothetical protein
MTFYRREHLAAGAEVNGLGRKLANLPQPSKHFAVCCWSDLLGLGRPFSEANWSPADDVWSIVSDRLVNAAIQYSTNLDPAEFALTLNDGFIRTRDEETFSHPDHISMWLRACIYAHNAVFASEHEQGLPGARTVLAAGQTLRYSPAVITRDDFVYNYTKADASKPSSQARQYGDPIVAMNPGPLQMNTAFSKAYILEAAGSDAGLPGPHFYVDESAITWLRAFATRLRPSARIIWRENGDGFTRFAVSHDTSEQRYHFGFDLGPVVDISVRLITSRVWRVCNFYPCDEDVADFMLSVR